MKMHPAEKKDKRSLKFNNQRDFLKRNLVLTFCGDDTIKYFTILKQQHF